MNLDSGYAFSHLGICWYAEAVVDAYCLWKRFFRPKLEDLMAESSDADYCDECDDRWEDAVFAGLCAESQEICVLDERGAIKVSHFRQRPES